MTMASSFEKSVKGGTKIKLAAPKSKYVEHILVATHAGEQGVAEVFRVLQNRLRDSTWTIVFKSLIIVHFMIREGEPNVTLRYLSKSPNRKLAINNFTEVQTQGRNIRTYAEYLVQRATSYGSTNTDYVRAGLGRLKKLSVEKGLLRETESIQDQIKALLHCDFLSHEPENDISLTAFRLLTMDLLVLFNVMNEGMVNILEHFFEMSKPDAERTLGIYRTFVKQTDQVVNYLSIARHYEHVTRLEIPKIKHAPTSLAGQLEEYVRDNDFEVMRKQYLAGQQVKKVGKAVNGSGNSSGNNKFQAFMDSSKSGATKEAFPEPKAQSTATKTEPKGPAPDLIDFFESIEQNQQAMATNPFYQPQFQQQQQQAPTTVAVQPSGFPQPTTFGIQTTGMAMPQQQQQQQFNAPNATGGNPFLQMQQQQQQQQQQVQPQQTQQQAQPHQIQTNFTGAGFGGYTPQPQQQQQNNRFQPGLSSIPQSSVAPFQQQPQQPFATGSTLDSPASSNPFRQSMISSAPTSASTNSFGSISSVPTGVNRQSTNPFAKSGSPSQGSPATSNSPFSPPNFSQQQQQPAQPLMPAATGTNPFARAAAPTSSPFTTNVASNPTGSTNPFRQSQFINQNTGQAWQNSPQGTIGGINPNEIPVMPVFPRPGQQPNVQSQPTGWQLQ